MNDRILVVLQLALIPLTMLPIPDYWPPIYLIVLFIAGESLLLWVIIYNRFGNWSIFPKPKTNAKFVSRGPYRIVRHPMYLGLLMVLLSFVLWQPSLLKVAAFLSLCSVIVVKIGREEQYLSNAFAEWGNYTTNTRYRLVKGVW